MTSKGPAVGKAAELCLAILLAQDLGQPHEDLNTELSKLGKKLSDSELDYRMGSAFRVYEELSNQLVFDGAIEVYWTGTKGFSPIGKPNLVHPADIVLKYSDGNFLGISLKSQVSRGRSVNLTNKSLKTIEKGLGVDLYSDIRQKEQSFLKRYPLSRKEIKQALKAEEVYQEFRAIGKSILIDLRDQLLCILQDTPVDKIMDLFLPTVDPELPYVLVKVSESQVETDYFEDCPIRGALMDADKITFEPSGQYVVRCRADNQLVMTTHVKYSHQKLITPIVVITR